LAPAGGKSLNRSVFRKAVDGYCYLHDYWGETPSGNVKGHGIRSYDPEQKSSGSNGSIISPTFLKKANKR